MLRHVLASLAAAGLLVAPISAQANTRASESRVSLAPLKGAARAASPIGPARNQADDEDRGMPIWLLVLLFGAAGGGIIAAVELTQSSKSPGT